MLSFVTPIVKPLLALAFVISIYLLNTLFRSPLAKIPAAHWTCRFSSAWIDRQRKHERENRAVHAAHQKHGSIVLLGPGEVSAVSLEAVKTIYGGGLERTEWFDEFKNYNTHNLLTLYDYKSHAIRRRMMTNVYSKSYLLKSSAFQDVEKEVLHERLMPVLEHAAEEKEGIDVYELMSALCAEYLSSYAFGTNYGMDMVRRGKEDERRQYCEDGKKKVYLLEGGKESAKVLEDQYLRICKQVDQILREDGEFEGTPATIFTQLRQQLPAKENVQDQEHLIRLIASELLDSTEAARVGPGIVLTYAMHELSQKLELQAQLREELSNCLYSAADAPCTDRFRSLDSVPLLDAIVIETLRRYPPAPGPQRRRTSPGGIILEGRFVPGGVTVHTSPYNMHRNERAFPEPELWMPQRWLRGQNAVAGLSDPEKVTEKDTQDNPQRWLFQFSSGGKTCLGNNFTTLGMLPITVVVDMAYLLEVMKLVLAAIYTKFRTRIIDDTGIEQVDSLMAPPKGDKLILGFEYV